MPDYVLDIIRKVKPQYIMNLAIRGPSLWFLYYYSSSRRYGHDTKWYPKKPTGADEYIGVQLEKLRDTRDQISFCGFGPSPDVFFLRSTDNDKEWHPRLSRYVCDDLWNDFQDLSRGRGGFVRGESSPSLWDVGWCVFIKDYWGPTMAQQRTYLLAPNFTFKPETGPIALGNIIVDPFRPHRVISPLDRPKLSSSYPPVETVPEYDRKLSRDTDREVSLAAWAEFLQTASAKLGGGRASNANNEYTMESLETVYFASDPSQEEIEARVQEPRVQAAIKLGRLPGMRNPVYMVTGLKIAKGFAGKAEKGDRTRVDVEAGGAVPTPAGNITLGANVAGSTSLRDTNQWRTGVDIVFAYQLLKIEVKGWKGKEIRYDEFRHKAAYLSTEDEDDEDEDEDESIPNEVTLGILTASDLAAANEDVAVNAMKVGEGEGAYMCISFSEA